MALRLVTLAFLAIGCRAARLTTGAEEVAQAWLKAHDSPDAQGMNDLKASNPEAFGIVQALLTKKSLGLLDPKHPSASFSEQDAPAQQESGPSAIDVLKASLPEGAGQIPVSAVAMSEPRHYSHNVGLNYKPPVDDDAAAVQSVLGMVGSIVPVKVGSITDGASSTGSLLSSSRSSAGGMNKDMTSWGFGGAASASASTMASESEQKPAPVSSFHTGMPTMEWGNRYAGTSGSAAQQPATQAVASMSQATSVVEPAAAPVSQQKNSYLDGIDLTGDMPAATAKKPVAAMSQQNSYLTNINFDSTAQKLDEGTNSLTSFNWNAAAGSADAVSNAQQVAAADAKDKHVETQYIQQLDEKADAKVGVGSLGAWLGTNALATPSSWGSRTLPASWAQESQRAPSHNNNYMSDLR